jgi:hypothetical protein
VPPPCAANNVQARIERLRVISSPAMSFRGLRTEPPSKSMPSHNNTPPSTANTHNNRTRRTNPAGSNPVRLSGRRNWGTSDSCPLRLANSAFDSHITENAAPSKSIPSHNNTPPTGEQPQQPALEEQPQPAQTRFAFRGVGIGGPSNSCPLRPYPTRYSTRNIQQVHSGREHRRKKQPSRLKPGSSLGA